MVAAIAAGWQADGLASFPAGKAGGCEGSANLGSTVGVRLGCPGAAGPTTGPAPTTATTGRGAPPPGRPGDGPGQTSVPVPNAWGFASCPSGAGSNAVLPVNQYGPGGDRRSSKSVICPSAQTGTTASVPPPPPPSAGQVWAEVPLPRLVLGINPAAAGITQLPSWFWVTGGGGPVTVTVEMGGYTVTAAASPVAYQWVFGDGTSALSNRAGALAGPSVTHTYVAKGTYTVALAVEYAGSYSFAGPGGAGSASLGVYWQPGAGTSYTVQEVRSVLVPTGGR